MKIFVGYAREDNAWRETLSLALNELAFVEIMIDKRAHEFDETAEDWRLAIRGLVKRADLVLLLISKSWEQSVPCRAEFDDAEAMGKPIIPIAIDAAFPIESWPKELSRNDACVLTDPSQRRDELDRLRAKLRIRHRNQRRHYGAMIAKSAAIVTILAGTGYWTYRGFFPPPDPKPPVTVPQPFLPTSNCANSTAKEELMGRRNANAFEKFQCLTEFHCAGATVEVDEATKSEYCIYHAMVDYEVFDRRKELKNWNLATAQTVCSSGTGELPWTKHCLWVRANRFADDNR